VLDTHISGVCFKNTLEIMDYYIAQQLSSENAVNDPAIIKAHKLYKWLCDHSEYEYVNTSYLLQKSPRAFRNKQDLEPVIKTLEEYGLMQDAGPGRYIDGYGLSKKSWKVNRGFDAN
jgi:hypothetical protein